MRILFAALMFPFLFLLSGSLHAQERHSISLSYACISLHGLQQSWKDGAEGRDVVIIPGEYGYKAVGYDKSYSGILMLSYNYHFSEKVRAGMDVGYESVKKKWDLYERPQGPETVNQQIHSFYFLPGAAYSYPSRNPSLRVSSAVQAGVLCRWSDFRYSLPEDKEHYSFAAQVWFIALEYKQGILSLNCDVGAGSMGFLRIGLACHL